MEKSTCFLRIIIKNSNISNEDINVKYHINIFVHRYSTSYYSNYFKLFNFFFQRALENARSHRVVQLWLARPLKLLCGTSGFHETHFGRRNHWQSFSWAYHKYPLPAQQQLCTFFCSRNKSVRNNNHKYFIWP